MSTWANTTFTTPADLAKIEEEINRQSAVGTTSYTAEALNIAATTPTTTSVSVSNLKGVIEFVSVINTTGAIDSAQSLTVTFQDSDDDVTFAAIHTGSRVYYKAGTTTLTAGDVLFKWVVPSDTEDYVKAVIASNAANSGKIDIMQFRSGQKRLP